jgi:SAM-dependent methyltransferase
MTARTLSPTLLAMASPEEILVSNAEAIVALQPANVWYGHYWVHQGARLRDDLEVLTGTAKPGSRLLDVGVNPPFMLATMRALGYEAQGVDLHPESFKAAIERFGLDVRAVDIEREPLPFDDGTFDVVYMAEVFEHLRINPIFTARELHRVLRPGGKLLLRTPNLYSLPGFYSLLVKGTAYSCASDSLFDQYNMINNLGFFGHIREYTYQELTGFLKRIGFADVRVRFWGGGGRWWTRQVYRLAPNLRYNMMLVGTK